VSLTTVLLISSDPDFASAVIGRWQCERTVPAFVTLGDVQTSDSVLTSCDMAITGPASSDSLSQILRTLETASRPAICLVPDSATASTLRQANSRVIVLREHEAWADTLVALGSELLRRLEATARARRAEQSLAEAQQNSTLGRYMLDMRHSLNNALTSMLGNSELLLLEPGALSAAHRDQVTTLHSMALRIHEIFQRFTSLELEMKLYAQSHHEMSPPPPRALVQPPPRPEGAREEGAQTTHGGGVS
jgi:signal transduction histidine kinase